MILFLKPLGKAGRLPSSKPVLMGPGHADPMPSMQLFNTSVFSDDSPSPFTPRDCREALCGDSILQ